MHNFFEYHWVYILTEHVEQKPVPDIRLRDYRVDDFSSDEAEPDVE